jgi:TP901 family phage tail tape measure protein
MADRSVVVNLLVRTNQFTSGLRSASHTMASETTIMESKVKALRMQVGLLGVGMVAFAAIAVAKWAAFDKAMSRVEATGGQAAAMIDDLNDAAKSDAVIQLGYDAVQASDAIYELTKAGVGATDIIGGAMAGALSLAAAETMDAAEAAAIMASALGQFGLKGDKAAHVADLITAAAGKAQGSAHDLGFALKQSGLVANQFGLSIEDTTAALGFFASAGLIGSDAGTSLRTMLLHLAGPSTKAAKLMDTIGLEIYKSNGQMVDMKGLADNLQSSMGKLTEQQRNQALATIFGADATRAASLLYREGGDAIDLWRGKVDDAGYAQEVARKRMDNLSGDITKLGATWNRSLIEMGKSADAPMRNLVQHITDVIDWFGKMPAAIQGVILALTGGGGLVILAVLGIGQIVGALKTLGAGLVATGVITEATAARMATAFGIVTKSLGWVGLAVGTAIAAFALIKSTQDDLTVSTKDLAASYDVATGKFNSAAKSLMADQLNEHLSWLTKYNTDFGTLGEAAEFLKVNLGDLTDAMLGNEEAAARVSAVIQAQKDLFGHGPEADLRNYEKAKDAGNLLAKAIEKNTGTTQKSIKVAEKDAEAKKSQEESAEDAAAATGTLTEAQQKAQDQQLAITAQEVAAQKAHDQYVSSIVDSFTTFFNLGDVYKSLVDAQTEVAKTAAEKSKDTKDSWQDFYDGTSVSAKDYIKELEKQVKAQEHWADNLTKLTARLSDDMPAELQDAADAMIDELRGLGPDGAAQIELLKGMSDKQLKKVVELYERQGVAAGESWSNGVAATEPPEIDIDTSEASARLTAVGDMLDNLHDVQAEVDVETANATRDLNAWIAKNASRNITVSVRGVRTPQLAGGGGVSGPGTGTSDSVPALLSNGEHVFTASDVQKAGGQDAMYRLRGAIQSGMLRFAGGGAVGGHSLEYWKSKMLDHGQILDLQIKIRDLKKDLAASGKEALKGLDRKKAQYELKQANQDLDLGHRANAINAKKSINQRIHEEKLAEKAEDKAKAKAKAEKDAAAARKESIADSATDFRRDVRHGDFQTGVTGGASGAYSAIDQARNSILPNLTGKAKDALKKALDEAEKSAGKLYKQLDGVDKKLEAANEKAAELQGISDEVKGGLVGGFSLGSVSQSGTVNPFTGKVTGGGPGSAGQGMLHAAQAYAAKVKVFAGKLKQLADKGFQGVILQEVAAMGVDAGIPAADALLSLNANDTKALNQAYKDIADFSGQAGQAVTEGFYKGGLKAADGVVDGLEAKKKQIQQSIMDMALEMQDALWVALGLPPKNKKKKKDTQGTTFVGSGTGVQSSAMSDASARLSSGVTVPGGYGASGSSGSGYGAGSITAVLSDVQVERLAVAFETGNVRNINSATAQKNRNRDIAFGVRGR